MSRPWKSELKLELRTHGCEAELCRIGWSRKVVATASASGRGAAAISAAIAALRMADTQIHAADARLVVADEYVDFALMGPEIGANAARPYALDYFANALGHQDLLVQTTPLPGARGWLAAAIDKSDYDGWMDALRAANVRLSHVHPALVEDLRQLSDQVPEDDAVVALLREEGATLLRLEDGVPARVAWERFDTSNLVTLEQRLRGFARQTGAERADATVVYMLPQSKALCRFVWDERRGALATPALPVKAHAAQEPRTGRSLALLPRRRAAVHASKGVHA